MSDMGFQIRLRPVLEEDLAVLFTHQADDVANRLAQFPPRDRESFEAHWHQNVLSNPRGTARVVLFGNEVAGNVVAWEQHGVLLLGYWIGREFWGKGVATAAVAQFLKIVTERPIYAHVAVNNLGSIRVLEKNDFRNAGSAEDDGVKEYTFILYT
ncbi:MAG: GNAT family N-acetyltransferase [Thermoanaerobaculia bacterium]|jgi:RimJ/RimL family protein N-acetyltransferase